MVKLAWREPTAWRRALGLTILSKHRPHPLEIQRLLGDELLQPGVLHLELLQSLGVAHIHPAEF
jgi:hypothetical protein